MINQNLKIKDQNQTKSSKIELRYRAFYPTKKSAFADSGDSTQVESNLDCHLTITLPQNNSIVKTHKKGVEVAGFAPAEPWVTIQVPYSSTPTPLSTLSKNRTVDNIKNNNRNVNSGKGISVTGSSGSNISIPDFGY